MLAILAPLVTWLIRGVVVKFLYLTAIFALLAIVIPVGINLITPHIGTAGLSSAFSGVGAGVWWFLDFFNLAFGVPLLISAYVARFLVRRLPLIG